MDSVSLEKAMLYERYRLPYAREAVDGFLDRTESVEVVADIGAGTGQLARLFSGRCKCIYVVEPDSSMRHVAQEVLKHYPEVVTVEGSAEQTTLATDSIDLIVIGNAFHRFRAEACGELHRILSTSRNRVLGGRQKRLLSTDYPQAIFTQRVSGGQDEQALRQKYPSPAVGASPPGHG